MASLLATACGPTAALSRTALRRPAAAAAPLATPRRRVVARAEPEAGGAPSSKFVAAPKADEFKVPRTGRDSPMDAETHRSAQEQHGGAPEGDRAVLGQAWQPTGDDGETPEDRFGSKQAAEEAQERFKDHSRKSERQTGDEQGNWGEGGT